ncbi:MAG TPA: hypothetical protein DEB06_00560 [Phycisphaerales bacterium]|nr:hypothetical protein [Phycisphaerales bacterium]
MDDRDWSSEHDRARAPVYAEREADWRVGAVVYQAMVDRFAPPADLESKRHLYPAPKRLMEWREPARARERLVELGVWGHEVDFWGGDIASVRTRLDHLARIGVDVLYLNPIHEAFTNHKYDALDYAAVSPEFGTREDVKGLASDLHRRGMRLMLDGVFNHMGRNAPIFVDAVRSPTSPWRDWFFIGPEFERGYLGWWNIANLPEVRLESPLVRSRLWGDGDSVVRGWLRDGVDGWRLDVAYDIGFAFLKELTDAAHEEKPGSWVVGEVWNYPEEWTPALDGVMNFHAREIVLRFLDGQIPGGRAGRMLDAMIRDAGIEATLRSWIVMDNHDTARLAHRLPDPDRRRTARVLQMTLPGAPCVYYGSEVEMDGGDDPGNRSPMRWDLVADDNPDFAWFLRLVSIRRASRALRLGDWRVLDSDRLLAFLRRTERWSETVVVLANALDDPVRECVAVRDSKLMNYAPLVDALSGGKVVVNAGLIEVTVPARSVMLLRPPADEPGRYSPYERVR